MKTKTFFTALLCVLALVCLAADSDNSSKPLIADGATVELVASDFTFTEGPVSDAAGNLYFTDVQANRIVKLYTDGTVKVFMENTQATNGLYFDNNGQLVGCVGDAGKIAIINLDTTMTDLATAYNGNKFNAPNDLWVDPRGGIYFTDPSYNRRGQLPQDGEHVYYLKPDRKTVIRVIDNMTRPNGLIGTPDGKIIYVADHQGRKTVKYTINEDGTLSNPTLFASQGSDGVTMDEKGNVYLTSFSTVDIFNPAGEKIESIQIPQQPSNVTFAGPDKKTLFITARTGLYKIKMNVKGI